jgi:predicted transcriptional regulator
MTSRRATPRPLLSDLEHDVMHAVWQAGPATVEAVHDDRRQAARPQGSHHPHILRRLEHKGYLRHEVSGRAYIYRAVEEPRSLAARAVRQLIDRFCRGRSDDSS